MSKKAKPNKAVETESEGIAYRRRYKGLIGVRSKVQVRDSNMLSLVYTPGVAEPCLEIARDPQRSFDVTCRGNTVAIISDGSSAFGLGDVGPEAILPVLESKAVIMKTFAGVDGFPIALKIDDKEEFIDTVLNLAPTFGAIAIEDVSSPDGLDITDRLERALYIPVINNHREGVAIGVGAAILGGALFHHAQHPPRNHSRPVYYQTYPQQQQVYVAPYCPPKPSGHWEWQKIWVPTVCEKTWNPGHYNRRNHWVPGHWIRINKQSGYWRKEKIWVSY